MKRWGATLGLIAALAACVAKPPAPPLKDHLVLTPVSFGELADWDNDRQSETLSAFRKSCGERLKYPDSTEVGPGGIGGKVSNWRAPCTAANTVTEGDDRAARTFFETWFLPYRAANNATQEGLFTGYYEPELNGSRTRTGPYQTPLLRRPPDLIAVELGDFRPDLRGERIAGRVADGRLRPYASRAEIESGALDRYDLGLFWVDDPIGAFFLQIQGSGRIVLADGTIVRVGYDGQNGQTYLPIGRVLVERGAFDTDAVTMQGIRTWLMTHPDQAKEVMDRDASYVFFREMTGDGPLGSEGVVLTPARSLAVDRTYLPLGVPIWLDLAWKDGPNGRMRRLVVAQDSGGAIRGPVRGDLFWGHGMDAETQAGAMKARGSYVLLLPKSVAPPVS